MRSRSDIGPKIAERLSTLVYCPYCHFPGRVSFIPVDGGNERENTRIVTSPKCRQLWDAFFCMESADQLNGGRLPRPTEIHYEPIR